MSGLVKILFGQSECVAFKEVILPTFTRFLKKCYTVQECQDQVLPDSFEFFGLVGLKEHDGVEIHRIEDNWSIEEDYMKTVAPQSKPMLKSNYCATSTDRWTTKSTTKMSQTIPAIKFRPPWNSTKPIGVNTSSTNSPNMPSTSHTALNSEKCNINPSSKSGPPSHGPTLPVSRAQTPGSIPSMDGGTSLSASLGPTHIAAPTEPVNTDATALGACDLDG
ncbi:hypothetical protein HYPSUDRAFT_209434 [Hypholoma sublateritium FD-334 SS-4]|uniref:Uncharacterized protein n=1 Tax=Hypholoma sublateritium (strain FD-334 SS-4) TaxID=945553 RepID=A0A0D2LRU5_HYPSF|nr:hypothetical protein HYPSUDRAFT_209434 [Hypholoma sublateritium FD-334 SS-4]